MLNLNKFAQILEKINNDSELNKDNIIEKIKEELHSYQKLNKNKIIGKMKETLRKKGNIYKQWQASEFDINYTFILLNKKKQYNYTLLQIAAMCEYSKVIVILLENKVQLDAQSKDGSTALHYAVICKKVEAIKILLNNGAWTDIKDRYGNTPLDYDDDNLVKNLSNDANKTVSFLQQTANNQDKEDESTTKSTNSDDLLLKNKTDNKIKQDKYEENSLAKESTIKGIPSYKAVKLGITIAIMVGIITPLILECSTALSTLVIVEITLASTLIVGSIAISIPTSKLNEINCNNILEQHMLI